MSKTRGPFVIILILFITLFFFSSYKIIGAISPKQGYEFTPIRICSSNSAYLWAVNLSFASHTINVLQAVDINNDSVQDIIVGTNLGVLALNGTNGSLLWSYPLDSVTNIVIDDLNADSSPEIITNGGAGGIYVLNRTGNKIWQNEDFLVKRLQIINVQNDKFVFGITDNKQVFCINGSNHQKLWNKTFENTLNDLETVDINNDTVKEGLIACFNKLCAMNATNGYVFWNFSVQRQINVIDHGRINKTSLTDIFIGTADNNIYALNGSNGQRIWQSTQQDDIVALKALDTNNDTITDLVSFQCWDYYYSSRYLQYLNATTGALLSKTVALEDFNTVGKVHDIECGDLDGDGLQNDLAVSTEYHKILAVKGLGIPLWQRIAEEEFSDIAVADLNNDSKDDVIVGTFDGAIYAIDSNNALQPDLGLFISEIYFSSYYYYGSASSTLFNNKNYYLHLIIRNLGTLKSLEFNYSLYIDEETATNLIEENSITLSSYDIAGEYLYIDWLIPSKLIGLHTLIITIDSGNEIEESNEMDNRIEILIQINWDFYPFLGYLFIFLGIGIAVVDIIIYQMKKGPHIARPSPENPTGGRP